MFCANSFFLDFTWVHVPFLSFGIFVLFLARVSIAGMDGRSDCEIGLG